MMMYTTWLVAALLPASFAFPIEPRAAENRKKTEAARAAAVQEAFNHAWTGYMQYAFPHDELHPVSNTYGDSRNGWGASAVDAFSTALIMGNTQAINTILDYIPTIDYTKTADDVSLFETTIRYLAGMLAGYDLLKGPLSHLTNKTTEVDALLTQAVKLADVLKFAFDTPSGLANNGLNIVSQQSDGSTSTGLAVAGTLVLEWTHLSDLTGDSTYANLSQKCESYLLNPEPAWAQPFPGLVGTNIDLTSGEFLDASGGWNGGDDSFYEYLIKMYVYDSSRFGAYRDRWIAAADSSMKYLASHPSSRPDLTYLAAFNNQSLNNNSQHLACFDGGNFLLGGAVLKRQDYIDFGLKLAAACHNTYTSDASGIGPEQFSWDTSQLPASQAAFYQKNGFYITNGVYDLRPEVIESYYYAYRVTGNPMYQDWAWDAFVAINATTRTGSGFTYITDVNNSTGGAKGDNQESFLFAEVMKYSYLIHAPDALYQTENGGVNHFVFNTEAHPMKVQGPPI